MMELLGLAYSGLVWIAWAACIVSALVLIVGCLKAVFAPNEVER